MYYYKHVICIISFNAHKHYLVYFLLALLIFCHFTERKIYIKWSRCKERIEATLHKLAQNCSSETMTHPLSFPLTSEKEIFSFPK